MRVELVRDMAGFRIGAQHQAGNARAMTERVTVELRVRVRRALRMGAVPPLDDRRIDVVEPAAPVVPGDEDRRLVPEPTADDCIHLLDRPPHAIGYVLQRVLAEIGSAVAIYPGNRRQPS